MATASKALKQKKAVGGYLLKTFSCPSFLSAEQKLKVRLTKYTYLACISSRQDEVNICNKQKISAISGPATNIHNVVNFEARDLG
jgi:hypothetical protein